MKTNFASEATAEFIVERAIVADRKSAYAPSQFRLSDVLWVHNESGRIGVLNECDKGYHGKLWGENKKNAKP